MTYITLHHDLHKILLCKCKMSSKIGSLRCMKYIERKPTQYQPLKLFWGDNDRSQILKWDQKKMKVWGNIKSPFHRWLTVLLVKKDCKTKYGFEDSISNVNLNSATKQPVNVKLCEALFLLNHSNNITRN